MKLVENDPKMTPKVTPNDPKMTPNCPKSLTPYFCEHCLVSFTTRAHLMRHLKKNCKEKKKKIILFSNNGKNQHQQIINQTNIKINITHNEVKNINNISINNFGEENREMITDNFLNRMIKFPYSSIPKLIKKVHFNKEFPENMNLRMLNKKDNKLQIIKNGKWLYVNKDDTYRFLIDKETEKMDDFYEENKQMLNKINRKKFEEFQDKLGEEEKEIWNKLRDKLELIFWNAM
tara:strand:+ start:144 stop:842 length:699 start_codon:yes stop_codon:yes gene_type:complete